MTIVAYDKATFKAGGAAPGTLALWSTIERVFPGAKSLGIYAPRAIRGSDSLSLHAEGRAVDVAHSNVEAIADYAYQNRVLHQVQEIILYKQRRIWTANKDGWRTFSGYGAGSLTHVHIGQNRLGAGITSSGKVDPAVVLRSVMEQADAFGIRWWMLAAPIVGAATIGTAAMLLKGKKNR